MKLKKEILIPLGLMAGILLLLVCISPDAGAYSRWYYTPETAWFHEIGLDFLSDWLNSLGVYCQGGYVCVSEFYAGYLDSECQFRNVHFCGQGCEFGVCADEEPPPEEPECEPGWQCLDDMYLVYRFPNCIIREKYFCVWSCRNAECNWGTAFRVE